MGYSEMNKLDLLNLTTEIVSAHISSNPVARDDFIDLISAVYRTIENLSKNKKSAPKKKQRPAVPVGKSVTDDYIVCLENGKKLRLLKRYLRTAFGMSPEEYRAKWGLPTDYPMSAPSYSRTRRDVAIKTGLGGKRKAKGHG